MTECQKILQAVIRSINCLDQGILAAIDTISKKPRTPQVYDAISRLDEYGVMIERMRDEFALISPLVRKGDLDQVFQVVLRINQTLKMIRDDAAELLGILGNPNIKLDRPDELN